MSVHERVKHLKCKFCDKAFGYGSNLSAHIKSIHGGIKSIKALNNTCAFCDDIFLDAEKLKEHIIKVHAEPNNSEENFDDSVKSEPIENTSNVQEENQVDVKPFKCDLCDKTFDNKYHLRHHVKHIHEKEHKCALCEKAYGSALKLKDHVMSVHEGVKHHKCEFCDRRFGYQTALSGKN